MFALVSPTEHVNSPARVIADGKVQHKYLNPHLIAIATESRDPTEVAKCKKSLCCMYDVIECMYDVIECMYDVIECTYDVIECMYDVIECMYDVIECI